jgi:eukaryotic-like serine/threonine-protein kinase
MSSLSPRISGALSGHYRLEDEIGAGGMATVYLAHDLRHDRRVAVKVLRPELAAVIGAERFLAEIKLTANLQHPHILPLFDSGEAESFLYYVMPYVEGESLRDRISREKQLPVDEAVRLAVEVASALDYAHRHGVVHRDIKPENILLHDGRALVADFGIALAASKASGARMTETGMSLGTPQYMSPEQAMGEREITARSDVYALGAVLYELLSGDPPFVGSTAQAIVARVVTESPRPLLPQRHTIPAHVEAAVLTALEKLPADRFATAAQFAEALTRPGATKPVATVVMPAARSALSRSRLRDPVTLVLGGLALASLAGLAATLLQRSGRDAAAPIVRFEFTGSDSAPVIGNFPWDAAISPDGRQLVYTVAQPSGTWVLYLRRSDQLEGHPVAGTLNASQPLFSPDGRWLAFESNGMERKVRLDGSAPVGIAPGASYNGADWTVNEELVLGATGKLHGLSRVSVAGGELTEFTHPDSAPAKVDHLWPIATPDGKAVVFTIWSGTLSTAELGMVGLDGGHVSRLGLKGLRPLAVVDGVLVYVQADGAVMGVSLDARRRRLGGRPVPVLDPVPVGAATNGNSAIFVSSGGALVTGREPARSRLTWVGRDGTSGQISPVLRSFLAPRLSPDGRKIAVLSRDGGKSDVWIYELDAGTLSRLTSIGSVTSAGWTHDGTRVVYSAAADGTQGSVWAQSAADATAPQELLKLRVQAPFVDLAPDDGSLILQTFVNNSWDAERVALDSTGAFTPIDTGPASALVPRLSPDGRWVALDSDESGTTEVYVRSYPVPTVKLQVSVGGGGGPVWSADGRRLYYAAGEAIMEARLAAGPGLRVVSRDTAFRNVPNNTGGFGEANYDVSRDGSRIVIVSASSTAYPLVVVPNWRAELRERMAASRH